MSHTFLQVPVNIAGRNVAALIDSGSQVNILSSQMYDAIPWSCKTRLVSTCNNSVTLADGHSVNVHGTCKITVRMSHGKYRLPVYVLDHCSFPMILGSSYLRTKGIVIDYRSSSVQYSRSKVRLPSRTVLPPNSEMFIWAKVSKMLPQGLHGVCTGTAQTLQYSLLVSKSLVSVTSQNLVPVKVLNPTDVSVTLSKNYPVAIFTALCGQDEVHHVSLPDISLHNNMGNTATVQAVRQTPPGDLLSSDNMCEPVNEFPAASGTVDPSSPDGMAFLEHFDQNWTELDHAQRQQLETVLLSNKDVFVTEANPALGLTSVVQHKIHLKPNFIPKHQRPYRLPPNKREVLRHQLNELLAQGVISSVDSSEDLPITSPIVLVSKRGKSKGSMKPGSREEALSMYRFCADFRHLNSQTQDFNYAIPDLQELTESFSRTTPNYITTFDLSSGFFQMGISPESARYTAFNTCFGTFKFLRLPQGLKTAPASFQMLMDKVLHGLKFDSVLCYLDDVILFHETFEEHIQALSDIFSRFRQASLKLNPKKCQFVRSSCVFLGHEISSKGISPPRDRVEAIVKYPPPRNPKELRRMMGLLNWFRKFIPNFSTLAHPLNKLLKGSISFEWTDVQQQALDQIKNHLANSEVLAFPNFDLPFRLAVDSSSKGIGYMLYQVYPESEYPPGTSEKARTRVVRFGSKSLSKWQSSYGPTKLELLGVVTSVLDCASYLRGQNFIVECDHQALKPLFQNKLKGAIYERWLAILQQFNFEIRYRRAADMVVPDALSRCIYHPQDAQILMSSPEEDDPFFPYVAERTGQIVLPDSGLDCTPQVNLIHGRSLNSPEISRSELLPPWSVLPGDDDEAYDADTDDIDMLPRKSNVHKNRFVDSTCVTNDDVVEAQEVAASSDVASETAPGSSVALSAPVITDTYTDSPGPLVTAGSDGMSDAGNGQSPIISNVTSDSDSAPPAPDPILSQIAMMRLFQNTKFTVTEVADLQALDPVLKPIIEYLSSKTLPQSQKAARKVILESADYHMIGGILFHSRVARSKRTKELSHYQLVLPAVMIKTVLSLFHDSPLGGHGGIQDTLDRLKEHYFFHSMASHVSDYVKSCPDCQKRKMTKPHTKSSIVAYPTPSGPFQVWEVDLYGKLPVTPQGNSFILTAVDMFSKYIVGIPIANKDALTVATALFQLFCTYGVCQTLISDRGTEFTAKVTRELCRLLGVPQQFTPSFMHHCLGACERTHATLATKLTPFMDSGKRNWQDVLPAALFSMNSAVNRSLGYSPHEIVFGQRPRFPLALPPVNLDTIPKDTHSFVQMHVARLKTISDQVKSHAIKAQEQMIDRTNANVHPLSLQPGDYVYMLKGSPSHKLQEIYSGPFVVSHLQSPHLVHLTSPATGRSIQEPVHINRLKIAYIRSPNPVPYFPDSVLTKQQAAAPGPVSPVSAVDDPVLDPSPHTSSEPSTPDTPPHPPRRSRRNRNPPILYGDPVQLTSGNNSDSSGFFKIKRVLAQRTLADQKTEYLVHISGEPAQNAIWVPMSKLDTRARHNITHKPPPVIT